MSETKVRLSLNVQGAQLLSSQECDKNPKESYDTTVILIDGSKKRGIPRKERLVVKTRKQRMVKQCLNISLEAYNYMTDPNFPPTGKLGKRVLIKKVVGKRPDGTPIRKIEESTVWGQYGIKQRLEWHLASIAESMRATGYTYEVFED